MARRGGSLIESVVAEIEARILSGSLAVGARLPSLRVAATQFGVSKNTMVEAYDRLVSKGVIGARPGSGYYVRQKSVSAPVIQRPQLQEAVDAVTLLSEQLERRFRTRIGEGRPPAAWTGGVITARHLREMLAGQGRRSGHYDPPAGYEPLRRQLSDMLGERSIPVDPTQILLTFGGNHALDLIIRQLVHPGERVLVESPGYYPLFAKLKLMGAQMVPVARGPNGPNPDCLEEAAKTSGARIFFTQSLCHNPTSGSLNLPTAHQVLRIADRYDLTIIEDDIFGDLFAPSAPRLAALDGLKRVLLVGSFAKTLSATLRVGYVTGPPAIIATLQAVKMLTVVNSCGQTERLVSAVLAEGAYRRHLTRMRRRISESASLMVEQLQELGMIVDVDPFGGYYAWLHLPEGIDDLRLARLAAEEDIFLAPGSIFYPVPKPDGSAYLRLNLGYADDQRFYDFMRRVLP